MPSTGEKRHLDGCELAYQVIEEVAQRISRQSPQAAIKITVRPQLYITDRLYDTAQVLRNQCILDSKLIDP